MSAGGFISSDDLSRLNKVFDRDACSSNYLAFLALLRILARKPGDDPSIITTFDLFAEMISLAWYATRVNGVAIGLREGGDWSRLPVRSITSEEFPELVNTVKQLLQQRAIGVYGSNFLCNLLVPFLEPQLQEIPKAEINTNIAILARRHFHSQKPLYQFGQGCLVLHPDWKGYFIDQNLPLQKWVAQKWASFLAPLNHGRLDLPPLLLPVSKKKETPELITVFNSEGDCKNQTARLVETGLFEQPQTVSDRSQSTVEELSEIKRALLEPEIANEVIPARTEHNNQVHINSLLASNAKPSDRRIGCQADSGGVPKAASSIAHRLAATTNRALVEDPYGKLQRQLRKNKLLAIIGEKAPFQNLLKNEPVREIASDRKAFVLSMICKKAVLENSIRAGDIKRELPVPSTTSRQAELLALIGNRATFQDHIGKSQIERQLSSVSRFLARLEYQVSDDITPDKARFTKLFAVMRLAKKFDCGDKSQFESKLHNQIVANLDSSELRSLLTEALIYLQGLDTPKAEKNDESVKLPTVNLENAEPASVPKARQLENRNAQGQEMDDFFRSKMFLNLLAPHESSFGQEEAQLAMPAALAYFLHQTGGSSTTSALIRQVIPVLKKRYIRVSGEAQWLNIFEKGLEHLVEKNLVSKLGRQVNLVKPSEKPVLASPRAGFDLNASKPNATKKTLSKEERRQKLHDIIAGRR